MDKFYSGTYAMSYDKSIQAIVHDLGHIVESVYEASGKIIKKTYPIEDAIKYVQEGEWIKIN